MTFFHSEEDDEMVGNNADEYAHIDEDGALHIDVTHIMEDGRGIAKLREMRDAVGSAIDTHTSDAPDQVTFVGENGGEYLAYVAGQVREGVLDLVVDHGQDGGLLRHDSVVSEDKQTTQGDYWYE